MADENRDTSVIYTGRSTSPAPSIAPHVVSMPPVVGAPASQNFNSSPAAPNLTPIVVRGAIPQPGTSPTAAAGGATGASPPTIGAAQQYMPTAPPLPSILRQPQAPQHVDPSLPRLRSLPVKEFLVSKSHILVIGQSLIASIMYIASWAAAASYEDHELKRRHVASILGFVFQIILTIAVVLALRIEPQLWVLYGLQVLSLITLFLTCVGMGMNNVVVDLCSTNRHQENAICIAHFTEFFAACFVASGMMLVFFAAQQRIALLVDKGVLSGLRGRMTQL